MVFFSEVMERTANKRHMAFVCKGPVADGDMLMMLLAHVIFRFLDFLLDILRIWDCRKCGMLDDEADNIYLRLLQQ